MEIQTDVGLDQGMTAQDVIRLLGMQEHVEGISFAETYRCTRTLALHGYGGERSLGTGIVFLITPDRPSVFHRVKSDELWHHYQGSAVRLWTLSDGVATCTVLGNDLASGERPQALVPAGVWQAGELVEGDWALLGATVSPGFEYDDFELADRTKLGQEWPSAIDLVRRLTTA